MIHTISHQRQATLTMKLSNWIMVHVCISHTLIQLLCILLTITHDCCYHIFYMFLIFSRISLVFQILQKIIMFILNLMLNLEFHANYCYVKKYNTNQIIHKGFLKDDLYIFPTLQYLFYLNVNIVTVAFINNVLPLWHSCFGHVSFHTIKHILTNCNIPFPKSSNKLLLLLL